MIGMSRRNSKKEKMFGMAVRASNILVNEKKYSSAMHSRSASATSTGMKTLDTESFMNLEFSNESRSSIPSKPDSPSWRNNCWNDNDMKTAMACPLSDHEGITQGTADTGVLRESAENIIKVIAHGTQLMATILFPTVIIKMDKKKLQDSMVYYVVLEPSSGQFFDDIVCLMFSSPHKTRTGGNTAELLPLLARRSKSCPGGMSVAPMLLDKRYRCLFKKGCTFEVKDIEQGRRLDTKGRKWKDYDLEKSGIHHLLRGLLFLDINQIPGYMFNPLKPSHSANQYSETWVSMQPTPHPRQKSVADLHHRKRSSVYQTIRPSGRSSRRSSFAKFLNTPPHTRADKDLVSYHKPKLRMGEFENSYELNKYVFLSGTI